MNKRFMRWYLQKKAELEAVWDTRGLSSGGEMLYEPRDRIAEMGLSKIAVTVILVAVAVALVLAVVAILGPAIYELATQTGEQIESVPMDWSP